MAFAQCKHEYPILGCFRHKETDAFFEYSKEPHNAWATENGATHSIHLTGLNTRGAIIKKTVAYIIVDEDENGSAVWEKWPIKSHRVY